MVAFDQLADVAGLDKLAPPPASGEPPMDGPPAPGAAPSLLEACSPVDVDIAGTLYGHYADGPPRTSTDVDAKAEAQKAAVSRQVEAGAQAVGKRAEEHTREAEREIQGQAKSQQAALPPAAKAAPAENEGPQTKETLERDLADALAKEETEIAQAKAVALEDLDAKIAEQRRLLGDAVLPENATAKMAETTRGAADEQKKQLAEQAKADLAANKERAKELREAAVAAARDEAKAMVAEGERQAKIIEKDGEDKARTIAGEHRRLAEAALAAADTAGEDKPEEQKAKIVEEARARHDKLIADGDRAAEAAKARGKQLADQHRQTTKDKAEAHVKTAEENGKLIGAQKKMLKGALKEGKGAVDEEANAHVDKARAIAGGTQEEQRAKARETVAALEKERASLDARLEREAEAKRKNVRDRIEALRKQVASAKPESVARLAGSVKLQLGQIDKASEQVEQSAKRQVDMAGRRMKAMAAQTIAVMAAKGRQAMAKIDAQARDAKRAIEARGKKALEAQKAAGAESRAAVARDAQVVADANQQSAAKQRGEILKSAQGSVNELATFAGRSIGAAERELAGTKERLEQIAELDWERTTKEAEEAAAEIEDELDALVNTDEDRVNELMRKFADDPVKMEILAKKYREKTGKELKTELSDDLDEAEMKESNAYLRADIRAANVAIVEQGDKERVQKVVDEVKDDPDKLTQLVNDVQEHTGDRASDRLGDVMDEDKYREVSGDIEGAQKKVAEARDERLQAARDQLAKSPEKLAETKKEMKDRAEKLHAALASNVRLGNDFQTTELLRGLNPAEIAVLEDEWKAAGYGDLHDMIDNKLDGADKKAAKAALSGDSVQSALALVQQAADGLGTNTDAWRKAMETLKTPEERARFHEECERQGVDYRGLNASENSGYDRDMMAAQAVVDETEHNAQVHAVDYEKATHGGKLQALYDAYVDTAVDVIGVSDEKRAEMRRWVRKHPFTQFSNLGTNDKAAFEALAGIKDEKERAIFVQRILRDMGKSVGEINEEEFSGTAKEVADAYYNLNDAQGQALEMVEADERWIDDNEDARSKVLERLPGESAEDWKKRTDPIKRELDAALKAKGKGSFAEWSSHGLDEDEQERAMQRYETGEVSEALQMKMAGDTVLGLGKDTGKMVDLLRNKSPDQVKELARKMKEEQGIDLFEFVRSKATSMGERRDFEILLEGNYACMKPEELQAMAKDEPAKLIERVKKLHEAARAGITPVDLGNAAGNALADATSDQSEILDERLNRALELEKKLAAGAALSDEERATLINDMTYMAGDSAGMVETKNQAVNAVAEGAGTVAELGVGIATGSEQAGALAGGLTKMGIKATLNPARYGADEALQDFGQLAMEVGVGSLMDSKAVGKLLGGDAMLKAGMEGFLEASGTAAIDFKAMRDGGQWLDQVASAGGTGALAAMASAGASQLTQGAFGRRVGDDIVFDSRAAAVANGALGGLVDAGVDTAVTGDFDGQGTDLALQLAKGAATKMVKGAADKSGEYDKHQQQQRSAEAHPTDAPEPEHVDRRPGSGGDDGPPRAADGEVDPMAPTERAPHMAASGAHDLLAVDTDFRTAANNPAVQDRAARRLVDMSDGDRAHYDHLCGGAENEAQRVMMERAAAAGRSTAEIAALAGRMKGMSEAEVLQHFTGAGLTQSWSHSCVATAAQIAAAEMDPVFAAWVKDHPEAARRQQGQHVFAAGGDLAERGPGEGGGRGMYTADLEGSPLYQQLGGSTGGNYVTLGDVPGHPNAHVNDGAFDPAAAHGMLQTALANGYPVIIDDHDHARAVVGTVPGPNGLLYIVQDPWTGATTYVPPGALDHNDALKNMMLPYQVVTGAMGPPVGAGAAPQSAVPGVELPSQPGSRGDEGNPLGESAEVDAMHEEEEADAEARERSDKKYQEPGRGADEEIDLAACVPPPGPHFQQWWNSLTSDELERVLADPAASKAVAANIRHPGGRHEWFMVAEQVLAKKWGVSMEEIQAGTGPTKATIGEEFAHTLPDGRTGPGSGAMHRTLRAMLRTAESPEEFLRMLNEWADTAFEPSNSARYAGDRERGRYTLPESLHQRPEPSIDDAPPSYAEMERAQAVSYWAE